MTECRHNKDKVYLTLAKGVSSGKHMTDVGRVEASSKDTYPHGVPALWTPIVIEGLTI
jgi:hypothetical protein